MTCTEPGVALHEVTQRLSPIVGAQSGFHVTHATSGRVPKNRQHCAIPGLSSRGAAFDTRRAAFLYSPADEAAVLLVLVYGPRDGTAAEALAVAH